MNKHWTGKQLAHIDGILNVVVAVLIGHYFHSVEVGFIGFLLVYIFRPTITD